MHAFKYLWLALSFTFWNSDSWGSLLKHRQTQCSLQILKGIRQILPHFIWTGRAWFWSLCWTVKLLNYRRCRWSRYIFLSNFNFCTISRLLGFRRAFPVVGRLLNVTSEIYDISDKQLRKTFFTSLQPYKNLCFYGTCRRYCDIYHPVCGTNGMLEVGISCWERFWFSIAFKVNF